MALWVVTVNGQQTIVRARTEESAIRQAMYAYCAPTARLATEQDLAWQEAMGGYVPPPEPRAKREEEWP